jgi:HD-GYP domain-containing protein (c-di-GMP phosphodiesterase class II)
MSNEKFCPIGIDQFIEKRFFDVDVFIQLSAEKFVLFGRAGSALSPEHLEKYKVKNIQYFFIRTSDFSKLADQAISIAGMVIGQKSTASAAKVAALENACLAMFGEIKAIGFDEVALGHATLVATATMNLVATYPALSDLVAKLIANSMRDERHAIMVSSICTMMGVSMGWTRSGTLERLALGGLLHDLGKLNLPADIISKAFYDMTHDEKIIYRSHCEFGRDTLSKMRGIPDDVRLMVFEHHEFADGSGFPRGIKDLFISPFGRVLITANQFTEQVLGFGDKLQTNHAVRAIEILESQFGKYNKDCIKALKSLVGKEWKKDVA